MTNIASNKALPNCLENSMINPSQYPLCFFLVHYNIINIKKLFYKNIKKLSNTYIHIILKDVDILIFIGISPKEIVT
jgi:hypothetical protein